MTPCHCPTSQGRKRRCGSSVGQSQALFQEHGPQLARMRGAGGARALPQQRHSQLEIPSSLARCREQSGFLRRPEHGGVPGWPQQHQAGWLQASRVRASMAQRWLGQGGPTCRPLPEPGLPQLLTLGAAALASPPLPPPRQREPRCRQTSG